MSTLSAGRSILHWAISRHLPPQPSLSRASTAIVQSPYRRRTVARAGNAASRRASARLAWPEVSDKDRGVQSAMGMIEHTKHTPDGSEARLICGNPLRHDPKHRATTPAGRHDQAYQPRSGGTVVEVLPPLQQLGNGCALVCCEIHQSLGLPAHVKGRWPLAVAAVAGSCAQGA